MAEIDLREGEDPRYNAVSTLLHAIPGFSDGDGQEVPLPGVPGWLVAETDYVAGPGIRLTAPTGETFALVCERLA